MKRIKKIGLIITILLVAHTCSYAEFKVNEPDGTVTDTKTGLMWMQSTLDLNNDGSIDEENDAATWKDALYECDNLVWAGHDDWRLPNIEELRSIVDYTRQNPAVDTDCFLNTKSDMYWSSTTYLFYKYKAWAIYFHSGINRHLGKTETYFIRPVRTITQD